MGIYNPDPYLNKMIGRMGQDSFLQRFADMIVDEDHFRNLLVKIGPDQRTNMYESLRPRISKFKVRALDVYIAEAKALAEAEQLPTLNADGTLREFKKAEIQSDEYKQKVASEAIAMEQAKKLLVLLCARCTKEQVFGGETKVDAAIKARKTGWVLDHNRAGAECEICPTCRTFTEAAAERRRQALHSSTTN